MLDPKDVKYIVIHCTDTPAGRCVSAADVDRWHKARGWRKIGYHFLVGLDGRVEKGRSLSEVGAHVSGYNWCSVGVCYVGGRDASGNFADTRTRAQILSLRLLVSCLRRKFPSAEVVAHRDLNKSKACPCFDVRAEF